MNQALEGVFTQSDMFISLNPTHQKNLSTLDYRLFTHVVQSFKAARGGNEYGAYTPPWQG